MSVPRATHVEIYVFRRRAGRVQLLTLRRAAGRSLPGAWQPVTGGIHRGERAMDAAAREVLEETGLRPKRWWSLETVTVYFDPLDDVARLLPLFAAEIDANARVKLSREHDRHAFLSASVAGSRYVWEAQRTALVALRREVLKGGPGADALEITQHLSRPRRGRSK